MASIDCYLVKRSLTGPDDECGDTGVIKVEGDTCFAALVDILGHGPEAHTGAVAADGYFAEHTDGPLVALLQGLHKVLRETRGGVAAACRVDIPTGEMKFCGVGNIVCRVFGSDTQRLMSRDGIIGYMMSEPREKTVQLVHNDIVMLHSDGIKEHFNLHDHPGLLTGSAKEIAERVMATLSKGDDDASCLIMRYLM